MIRFHFFFLSPLSFAWSNIELLDSMLTDWMLHEEVNQTLPYLMLVSEFFFCTSMIGLLNLEHLATKFLSSVLFFRVYYDVASFARQSCFTVNNIPYPLFTT